MSDLKKGHGQFTIIVGENRYTSTRKQDQKPSQTLITLMKFAKSDYYQGVGAEQNLFDHLKIVLGEIYHPKMSNQDVLDICTKAYIETIQYPEFDLGCSVDNFTCMLLFAPVRGNNSIQWPMVDWNKAYTVGAMYEAVLAHILGQFTIARIDWLPEHFKTAVELEKQ